MAMSARGQVPRKKVRDAEQETTTALDAPKTAMEQQSETAASAEGEGKASCDLLLIDEGGQTAFVSAVAAPLVRRR